MTGRRMESIQVTESTLAAASRVQHAFHCAAVELEAVRCRLLFSVRGIQPDKKGDLVDWLRGRCEALDSVLLDTKRAIEAEALEDALTGYTEDL